MKKNMKVLVATLGLMVGSPMGRAVTFQYTTVFDNSFDTTLTSPFVGTGSLTYDAVTALPNGSYNLQSFTALTLFFNFPSVPTSFDLTDLTTTPSQVNIVLLGSSFYFTNDTAPGGGGDGGSGGSADFSNGSYVLTTEPYQDGSPNPSAGVGGPTTPAYMLRTSLGSTVIQGTYGVVPEPSATMLLLVAGGLCFRRRRI